MLTCALHSCTVTYMKTATATNAHAPTTAKIAADYNCQEYEVAAACNLGTDYSGYLSAYENRWMRGVMDIMAEQASDLA